MTWVRHCALCVTLGRRTGSCARPATPVSARPPLRLFPNRERDSALLQAGLVAVGGASGPAGGVVGGVVAGGAVVGPVVGPTVAVGAPVAPPTVPPTAPPADPAPGAPGLGEPPAVGCAPAPFAPPTAEGLTAPGPALGLGNAVDEAPGTSRCRAPPRPGSRPSWERLDGPTPFSTGVPADPGELEPATSMHPLIAPVATTPTTTAAIVRPTPRWNLPTVRDPASDRTPVPLRAAPCPSNGRAGRKDTAVRAQP